MIHSARTLVLSFLLLFNFSAFSQASLNLTIDSAGAPVPDLAIFIYDSPSQLFGNGSSSNPNFKNFSDWAYTDSLGGLVFTWQNASALDTVYWASQDCNGNWVYNSTILSPAGLNTNGSLSLTCLPNYCAALSKAIYDTSTGTLARQAVALRTVYNYNIGYWIFGQDTIRGNYGLIPYTANLTGTYCYRRDRSCSYSCDTLIYGNWLLGGSWRATCTPYFTRINLGQTNGGYEMKFVDNSQTNGQIISRTYDFGDGNSSNLLMDTLNHVYANAGYYNVCLTVTSVLGQDTCTRTYCDTVHARIACTSQTYFRAVSSGISATGHRVTFSDSSIVTGNILRTHLNFGDGNFVWQSGPIGTINHSYTFPGTYYVCIHLKSFNGIDTCYAQYCDSLVVGGGGNGRYSHQCSPFYSVDTLNSGLSQNQIVVWEGSSSTGTIIDYEWSFGDGTIKKGQYPSHTYASSGIYGLNLTITSIYPTVIGFDTCRSTYYDTIGFDNSGNLVYKNGFTVNVVNPSLLEEVISGESWLKMYPNPSQGRVQLEWDRNIHVQQIKVLDAQGRLYREMKPEDSRQYIEDLPPGPYLIQLRSSRGNQFLRLIVQ